MYFVRHSMIRAARTNPCSSTPAKLQTSYNVYRRTFATSPNEPADDRGTPYWIYGMVAAGAGSILYLWRLGNQRAKAATMEQNPAHHGANAEYVLKTKGS